VFLLLKALRVFGEIKLRAGPVGLIADASVGLFAGLFIGFGVEDFLGGEILLSAVVVFAAPEIASLGDPGFPGKALECLSVQQPGFEASFEVLTELWEAHRHKREAFVFDSPRDPFGVASGASVTPRS